LIDGLSLKIWRSGATYDPQAIAKKFVRLVPPGSGSKNNLQLENSVAISHSQYRK